MYEIGCLCRKQIRMTWDQRTSLFFSIFKSLSHIKKVAMPRLGKGARQHEKLTYYQLGISLFKNLKLCYLSCFTRNETINFVIARSK